MPSDSDPEHVFVYGSLRPARGHYMQRFLKSFAEYVGPAETRGLLYDLGSYPGFVPGSGRVQGDLFRILNVERLLTALDLYEGDEYRRESISIDRPGETTLPAWIYIYTGSLEGSVPIDSGDYIEYAARGL